MLFVATLLGILLVGLALAGVVIAFQWRQLGSAVSLVGGLRADVDHLAGEIARRDTEREQIDKAVQGAIGAAHQRITSAHNVASMSLDRILYYTKVSKPLGRLGEAYDRAIKKIQAKMEADAKAAALADAPADAPAAAPESAVPAQPTDVEVTETSAPETTDDDMSQIAGSIGPAATPVGE